MVKIESKSPTVFEMGNKALSEHKSSEKFSSEESPQAISIKYERPNMSKADVNFSKMIEVP